MRPFRRGSNASVGILIGLALMQLVLAYVIATVDFAALLKKAPPEPTLPEETTEIDPIPLDELYPTDELESGEEFIRIGELRKAGDVDGLVSIVREKRTPDLGTDDPAYHRRVRVTAVHALANVGGIRARVILRTFLADEEEEIAIRLASADALIRTGTDSDIEWIREQMDTGLEPTVRKKILHALERHQR